jgi:hypothetical protein
MGRGRRASGSDRDAGRGAGGAGDRRRRALHRGRGRLCRKRPDPVSAVFGYHEVFRVLVIAAAALQYAAIAFFVLPGALE